MRIGHVAAPGAGPVAAPDPGPARTPEEFVRRLRLLKTWAGDPSYDELRRRTGVPRSTLAAALSNHRRTLPALDVVARVAAACGLPPAAVTGWETAWRRLRAADEDPVTPDTGVPAWTGPRPLLADLVGRDVEQADLLRLLGERRLITVVGPAGVGKTSLALHVATRARVAERVVVAVLTAAAGADDVLRAVAAAVGARGTDPTELRADLQRRLAARPALLVLDNCEHVADACGELVRGLLPVSDRLVVLLTSRRVLGLPGEVAWTLDPLVVPAADTPVDAAVPAVALFLRRAAEAAPHRPVDTADLDAVAGICRRLDGLPLALELAAARLRMLPVRELGARLDVDLAMLGGGRPGAEDRHGTLRAAVDWSYRLLPAAEQRLLARLSVFRGGFVLTAAEQVGGARPLGDGDVLPLLSTLVDHSLVQPYDTACGRRYRLLEAVREFAADRLADLGDTRATGDRLLAQLLARFRAISATPAFDDRLTGWRDAGDELDNVDAALEHGFAGAATETDAAELAALACDFWVARNRLAVWARWVRVPADVQERLPDRVGTLVRFRQAQVATMDGDFAPAHRLFATIEPALARDWPRHHADGVAADVLWRCAALDPALLADVPALLRCADRTAPGDAAGIRLSAVFALLTWGRDGAAEQLLRHTEQLTAAPDAREQTYRAFLRLMLAIARDGGPAADAAQADVLRLGFYQHRSLVHPERVLGVLIARALVGGDLAATVPLLETVREQMFGSLPQVVPRGQTLGVHLAEVYRRVGRLGDARASLGRALTTAFPTSDHALQLTAVLAAALLATSSGDADAGRRLAAGWDAERRRLGLPTPLGYAREALTVFGLDPAPGEPAPGTAAGVDADLVREAMAWCLADRQDAPGDGYSG